MANLFVCPVCKYPQYCGCPSCRDEVPVGFKPYTFDDHDGIICAGCGHTAHIDEWNDEFVRQYKSKLLSENKELPEWLSTVKS